MNRIVKGLILSKVLISSVILMVCFSCKNGNSLFKKGKKTVHIQFTEAYCGGAAPSEAMLAEMMREKPMANRRVEVYKNLNPDCKPKIMSTDSEGRLHLNQKMGKEVYISVYPPAADFQADIKEYQCYLGFINRNLIKVDLTVKEDNIYLKTFLHCNPCIPPVP